MLSHIGFIMDGNRRWAKKRGLPAVFGHKEGITPVKNVIKYALRHNIKWVTLYTFSVENLQRTEEEKSFLFDLLAHTLKEQTPVFIKEGIKVRFIGDKTLFPAILRPVCDDIENKTSSCTNINVNILFCYGGQHEIVHATRACMKAAQAGTLKPEELTTQNFTQYLWTSTTPAPEIIIRTGGMPRLSGFLPYLSAYSEIFFLDTLWPDFTVQQLEEIIDNHKNIQRNFGK